MALMTTIMAEDGEMGCGKKNGTERNIYTRNSKKKMLQRSNTLLIQRENIIFSQSGIHENYTSGVKVE